MSTRSDKLTRFKSMQDLLVPVFTRMETRANEKVFPSGLPTGLPRLDEITNGIEPGEIWAIFSRPGMGKHIFLYSMMSQWLLSGKCPQVYSFMSFATNDDVGFGLLGALARVDTTRIRSGRLKDADWPKLANAADRLAKAPFFTNECGLMNVKELLEDLSQQKVESPFVLVVDYFGGLNHPQVAKLNSYDRALELERCLTELHGYVKEKGGSLVVLSNLDATIERRPNKRPWNSDLGAHMDTLYSHSTVALALYRDEVYNRESEEKGIIEVIAMKNSKGETATDRAAFLPEYGLICPFKS